MKKRKVFYYIIYLFLSTFILCEIIFRVFDPFGVEYLFEIERYNETFKKDADFFYINQPGFSGAVQDVRVEINSAGLRNPEFDKTAKTKKRLLILGDSIVFGWGVEQDSIFVYRLNEIFTDSFKVIGAGTNSWNTRAEYEFLKKEALPFQPDWIFLFINPNDIYLKGNLQPDEKFSLKRMIRETGEKFASWSYTTATFLAFYQKLRHAKIMQNMYKNSPEALNDAHNALDALVNICFKNDIHLAAIIYGDKQTDLVKLCADFYGKILKGHGVPVHFLSDPALFIRENMNSAIDGHPNANGHKIIATHLENIIKTMIQQSTDL